jgi:hypothetical protein
MYAVVNVWIQWKYNWMYYSFPRELRDNEIQLMEQELPTLSEHLSSVPVFSGVRVLDF